jgi:hypothetical protein
MFKRTSRGVPFIKDQVEYGELAFIEAMSGERARLYSCAL